jgi:predicted ATPase
MLDVHPSRSILSQRSDPDYYPELYSLAKRYSQIHLYRGWSMGRIDAPRLPQPADALGIYLNENAANLGAVLNELKIHTALFDKFLNGVKEIAPRITRVEPVTRGGTVQVHIGEEGLEQLVPATRLADGTIRFMCLLTILMSTPPPSLVCIEEPELGLHPDMIRKVAELLVEASQRMQLIVTTHSDLLVSYLSEHVESIVVCEHDGKGTRMERLEREKIKGWLENYSLGEMWTRGHIGGNRW